jgi:hypothetical protein
MRRSTVAKRSGIQEWKTRDSPCLCNGIDCNANKDAVTSIMDSMIVRFIPQGPKISFWLLFNYRILLCGTRRNPTDEHSCPFWVRARHQLGYRQLQLASGLVSAQGTRPNIKRHSRACHYQTKIRVAYVRVGVIRERGDKSVRSARDNFMRPIRP